MQHIKSLFVDDRNQIWAIVTAYSFPPPGYAQYPFGIVARFNRSDGTFDFFEHTDDGTVVGMTSIVQDLQGRYWVGASTGLFSFDPAARSFKKAKLLKKATEPLGEFPLTELMVDRDGALWIASRRFGTGRIVLGVPGIERYATGDRGDGSERRTAWVDAAIKSRDGRTLWFSTGNEELKPSTGLSRLDLETGQVQRYTNISGNLNSLSDNYIRAIAEADDGILWIGTGQGINRLDPESDEVTRFYLDGARLTTNEADVQVTYGARQYPNYINDLDILSDGRLLVSTGGAGTAIVDPKARRVTTHVFETPLPEWHGIVGGALESADGRIWSVFANGAGWFDPRTGESKAFYYDRDDPTSVGAGDATSIHEDAEGRIWVGSFGTGLSLFEPESETWKNFGMQNGLPENSVTCITHDDEGSIWVSTFVGLSRLDVESETFENFWVADGLQGRRFAGGACSRTTQGELIFGGEFGFNVIRPSLVARRTRAPEAVLTAIAVSGKRLRSAVDPRLPLPLVRTKVIELSHAENNVLFEFAGVDFGRTGAREFYYKLEPLEVEWQPAGDRQRASYANLAPGTYTFSARVSVAGRMSPTPASIQVVIAPPWWASWWAHLLLGMSVLGLLYGGYAFRVGRLKAYSARLENEVAERTQDLEEAKRRTEDQARRLLELDRAKNRFFANISHEFRTPLTLIVGPLQDAVDGRFEGDDAELLRQHGVMLSNATRLLKLINQLLDLSKLESGRMELETIPGDVVQFLKGLSQRFAPAAERREIELSFQPNVDSFLCYFDADKLEKIVSNLVSNALKFTGAGGKVGVSLHVESGDTDGRLTISVKDTGVGIPASDLDRIFDRFQQVDESTTRVFEGTGIGLAMAKELAELHGGSIAVESQVNFGSTFRVEIPVSRASKEDEVGVLPVGDDDDTTLALGDGSGAVDREPKSTSQAEATILVVEDNVEVRSYILRHLGPRFEVIEASNGAEGLKAAVDRHPDLILSDVMMPEMDGYEMVRKIREIESLRHTPVIMLTAKADEIEAVEGLDSGADDYVAKPFGAAELMARISNLITRRRSMREQFSEEVVVSGSEIVVKSDDAAFLDTVVSIIDDHLDDPNFGGDWLADKVGLSRRQLERRLDAVLGESPAAMIRRFRLERASQLLRARAGTVSEIAYSVGFTNPAYFARAFRKAFGEAPSEHARED
ncbi:MAG: ATP-binding protein [Candidatus Latescibacterota bacterium]|jgi:signal transduction histidine kinase/AraC-like DNA-binding protein/streptogramin lyase